MYDIATGLIIIGIGFVVYFWKKDVRKRNLSIILTIISFVLFGMFSPEDSNDERKEQDKDISLDETIEVEEINDEEVEDNEEIEDDEEIELDTLQSLYLDISDPSKVELISLILDNDLVYSEKEFASGPTIKIAYTKEVSKIKYAESGDYINVSFNDDLEIENVSYFNNDKFLELIDYRHGTYWDFRDQPEYEGYYINVPGKELGSFTVKYDNGNESNTGYLKVDSKEEQFEYLFEYERE